MASTVNEPSAITSGGPTQTHMSPTLAWGNMPVSTVMAAGGRIGPPTWGTIPVTIGQTCMSVTRAAGFPIWFLSLGLHFGGDPLVGGAEFLGEDVHEGLVRPL